MIREKIAIMPRLYDCKGDLTKKWFIYFSVKDPRSGKMVRIKKYDLINKGHTKSERLETAKISINEYNGLLKNGYNPFVDDTKNIYTDQFQYRNAAKVYLDRKASNQTFNYFSGEYVRTQLSGLDQNTINTYVSKLRIVNQWLSRERYSDLDISAISNKVIIDLFTYLNSERKISKSTYNKYKQLLLNCFDYIIDTGKTQLNPVQRIPKCTRVTSMEPHPINDLDVEKFMDRIKHIPQMYLFISFEYYCFMRPMEIRMMKISWIDFSRGMITIPKEISKSRKAKTPLIPDKFMEILRDEFCLQNMKKDYFVIGKHGIPGFGHLGKNTMRDRFNRIRTELKMPTDYMLYSWKHTGNVRIAKASFPEFDRMMQNGHTSIKTTEVYTRNLIGFESSSIKQDFPKL
jgi:integrase